MYLKMVNIMARNTSNPAWADYLLSLGVFPVDWDWHIVSSYFTSDPLLENSVMGNTTRYISPNGNSYFALSDNLYTDLGMRLVADATNINATGRFFGVVGAGYYIQFDIESNGKLKAQLGGSASEQYLTIDNRVFDMVLDGTPATIVWNSQTLTNTLARKNPAVQIDKTLYVFAGHDANGTTYGYANYKLQRLLIWSNLAGTAANSVSSFYVPTRVNGEMELLNLVNGELATRNGTFIETIE